MLITEDLCTLYTMCTHGVYVCVYVCVCAYSWQFVYGEEASKYMVPSGKRGASAGGGGGTSSSITSSLGLPNVPVHRPRGRPPGTGKIQRLLLQQGQPGDAQPADTGAGAVQNATQQKKLEKFLAQTSKVPVLIWNHFYCSLRLRVLRFSYSYVLV